MFVCYFLVDKTTFTKLYFFYGFKEETRGDDVGSNQKEFSYNQIENVLIIMIPNLIAIWIKTISGMRAWMLYEFDRKSIE